MTYYGIKTPKKDHQDSYIHWISECEHAAWDLFFQYPDRNRNFKSHRTPLEEAMKAYEAIGYKCVELNVVEVEETLVNNDQHFENISSGGTIENRKSY